MDRRPLRAIVQIDWIRRSCAPERFVEDFDTSNRCTGCRLASTLAGPLIVARGGETLIGWRWLTRARADRLHQQHRAARSNEEQGMAADGPRGARLLPRQ